MGHNWRVKPKVNPTDKGSKYEVKLALTFMLRAMLNDWKFSISCNLPEAHKLDDIVFHNKTDNIYQFVQSKCKNRGFNEEDLLSESGDFCLSKYFISFFHIRNNEQFSNSKVESVLFTTSKLGHIKQDLIEQVQDADKILYFPLYQKNCYRFTKNMADKLLPVIQSSAMNKVASNLANALFDGRILHSGIDQIKPFMRFLSTQVIDFGPQSNAMFKKEFLRGGNLSADANLFRNELLLNLKSNQLEIGKLNDFILNNKLLLTFSTNFWQSDDDLEPKRDAVDHSLTELASQLVDSMLNRRVMAVKDDMIRCYRPFLTNEVFTCVKSAAGEHFSSARRNGRGKLEHLKQIHGKLFRYSFLIGDDSLTSEGWRFRDIFIKTVATHAKSRTFCKRFANGFDFIKLNEYLEGPLCLRFRTPKTGESVESLQDLFDKKLVEEFFENFILASSQPEGNELERYLRKDVEKLTPLSDRSVETIYLSLVFKMSNFHEIIGQWLHSEEAMNWVETYAKQPVSLINPLINYSSKIEFSDLNTKAQNYLLSQEISFQGAKMNLLSLLDPRLAHEVVTSEIIQLLKRNENALKIGSATSTMDLNQYVPRNLLMKLDNSYKLCNELEFLAAADGVDIVTAGAGMGKSTLLKYLETKLKQEDGTRWVLRIDLNDPSIMRFLKRCSSQEEFFEHFFLTQRNQLEASLFRHRAEKTGGMFILLDAFENFSEDQYSQVAELIRGLTGKGTISIILSSRSELNEQLENLFGKSVTKLGDFTTENQVDFLTKCWLNGSSKKFTLSEYNLFAEELIKVVANQLQSSEEHFFASPLFCRILAEVFQEPMTLPDRLDITQLFHHFWRTKVDIAFYGKLHQNRNDARSAILYKMFEESARKGLQRRALAIIFPDRPEIWENMPEFEWLKLCGMTDDCFPRNTFAEYFTALYISDFLQRENCLPSFLKKILIDDQYRRIRHFLSFLPKGELVNMDGDRQVN